LLAGFQTPLGTPCGGVRERIGDIPHHMLQTLRTQSPLCGSLLQTLACLPDHANQSGAGIACRSGFGWVATTLLFSWYVQNFGNFNNTYGSLGAAVGFVTWIWLSAIVILLGAVLDAILEDRPEDRDGAIDDRFGAGFSSAR
jgi:hypothetical protein